MEKNFSWKQSFAIPDDFDCSMIHYLEKSLVDFVHITDNYFANTVTTGIYIFIRPYLFPPQSPECLILVLICRTIFTPHRCVTVENNVIVIAARRQDTGTPKTEECNFRDQHSLGFSGYT